MDARQLVARLEGLVAAFNRASLDVPDGTIDRACTFNLNGTTYAESMGPLPSSPLLRLVALGPAAYRFLAQAVRYAMPDGRVALGEVTVTHHEHGGLATGTATLTGTFRGRTTPADVRVDYACVVNAAGAALEIGVHAPPTLIAAIGEARRS